MARYFIRCRDCLAVGAVDVEGELRPTYHVQAGTCPCGGNVETMGRVARSGRLERDELESVCDSRCTNARGPSCDCSCGGKNHGSHAVVLVSYGVGPKPRYMLTPDIGRALEYRVARREAELRLTSLNSDDLVARKLRGAYLSGDDFARYMRIRRGGDAVREAGGKRTHAGRLKALRAIEPDVRPAEWDALAEGAA